MVTVMVATVIVCAWTLWATRERFHQHEKLIWGEIYRRRQRDRDFEYIEQRLNSIEERLHNGPAAENTRDWVDDWRKSHKR